jgi:hypothetical protein
VIRPSSAPADHDPHLFVFDRAIPHAEEFERGLFEGTGLGGNPVSSFTKWNRDA